MAVDNTAIGSALIIPDSLLKNLGEIDKKIKDIQDTSKQTAQVFNTQFASMSLNTGNLLNNLQQVINQLGSVGQAAQTASSATQNMGSGLGTAAQGATNLGTSVTGVVEAINRMIGQLQQTGQVGSSSLMAAKLAADKLMEAMQFKNTGNIAAIKDEIQNINKTLKDTESALSRSEQQTLVERKRLLQEELKEAERTQNERAVNLQRVLDRMVNANEAYSKKEIAIRKSVEKEIQKDNENYLKQLEERARRAQEYQMRMQELESKKKSIDSKVQVSVDAEIQKEQTDYLKSLERQAAAEQEYQARMQAIKNKRAEIEASANKAVEAEIKQENDKYLNSLNERIKQEQDYQQRMARLKEKRKEIDKAASASVEAEIKSEKEAYMRSLSERIRQQQEYNQRMAVLKAQQAENERKTYKGAMSLANSATSINERTQAIKYLTEARNALSKTDADYINKLDTLNAKIKEMNAANRQAVASSQELNNSHRKLMDTAGKLQRAFALLFSVSQIKGYIDTIAKTRGYFELQQKSLQAILQDKTQADNIFNKTMALALDSPFRAKELITFTKQLAAYRIESDKLYDTTKRLADVSAGLGVDMQRLILAYGQVKAAAYLRGSEVRQFTEAGINMYGELQRYFQEVKGEAYTTAQIVDMISKRMVTFEDVEQIFQRITDKGGLFYNMQHIQVETLSGKIGKFKDAVDQMMNSIGKENEGIFKGVIDSATALLSHWEAVANVGKTLLGVLALVKMYSIQAGASMNAIFLANAKFASLKGANGLKMIALGFKNVGVAAKTAGLMIKSAFMANLPLVGLMVGYEVISSLISRYNEYSEAVRKTVTEYNKSMYALKELKAAYQDTASASDNASKKELSNAESKRKALEKLVEMMRKENLTIEFNVKDLSESEIEKYLDGSLERYEQFLKNKMKLDKLYDKNKRDTFFVDNIEEDAKDYENAASDLIAESDKIGEAIANLNAKYKELPESARIAFDELEKIKADDTNIENIEERIKKLQVIYSSLTMRTKGRTFAKIGWEDESSQIKHLIDLYKDAQSAKEELLTVKRVGNKYHYEGEFAKIAADLQTQYTKGIENGVKNGLTKAQARVQAANDVMAQITKLQAERGFSDMIADMLRKSGDFSFLVKFDKGENLTKQTRDIYWVLQNYFDTHKIKLKVDASGLDPGKALQEIQGFGKSYKEWIELEKQIKKSRIDTAYTLKEIGLEGTVSGKSLGLDAKLVDANTKVSKKDLLYVIKLQKEAAKAMADAWGVDPFEKEHTKAQRDILSEQIEAYKDLQIQYEKYLKIYDKETAKAKALESLRYKLQNAGIYKDAAGIVPDEKTIAGRIKNIAAKIKSIQKRGDAYKIVADFEYNIDKKDFDKKLEYIKADVEKAFNGLQLFKNLKGEGLSDVEIKSMFGNITNSFADVRKQIESSFASNFGADKNKWSKEVTEKYAEQMNKLDKQIYENSVSQFKELSKAYKDQLDERLKIDLWYAEERKKIEENEQLAKNPALKDEFIRNLDKQRAQKSDEADWKQFQNSDFYIRIFENLDTTSSRVLTAMKEKLASLRGSLKNLSPEQLKQVVDQIDKVDTQLVQRNPFKGLVSGIKDYIAFAKQRKQLEEKYLQSIKKEADLQSRKDTQAKLTESSKQKYEAAVQEHGMNSPEALAAQYAYIVEQQKLDVILKELVAQGKITEEYANQIRNGEKQKKETKERVSEIAGQISSVASGYGEVESMLHSFGVELPKEISGTLNGLSQASQGLSKIMNGDIIGGAFSMIAGIGNAIGSIFGFGNKDNKLQKEIEKQEKAITRLQRAYDKLKTAMDEAWSASDVIQANKDTKENIQAQISSYEKMIKAEEDKKKTDKSKIEEWENQIADLKEKLKELEEQTIETFGGIGESNYKSAAQEFADAWVDAFNATENTLDALNDTFDNFFYNMLKKQLMMRVAQKFLEPLFKAIDEAVYDKDKGSLRGIEEMKNRLANIYELGKDSMKQLDEVFKYLFEGWDIKPSGKGELSKLQQGIQSLTESTGQALESLLNSIRFFVAQQTTDVSAIRALLQQSSSIEISASTDTPMLSELRAQTNILRSINANIESIIRPSGHPKSGAGVKVFID